MGKYSKAEEDEAINWQVDRGIEAYRRMNPDAPVQREWFERANRTTQESVDQTVERFKAFKESGLSYEDFMKSGLTQSGTQRGK